MTRSFFGFTLIELMVVVAVIAILALLAVPSFQQRIVRDQIVDGSTLAAIAKAPIASHWSANKELPADNASIGLPAADKVVSNLVRSVAVEDGAIHMTFGNRASGLLRDRTLSLRPAVVDDAPIVPVAWVCGFASAPKNMTVHGVNKTDIPKRYLPLNCL